MKKKLLTLVLAATMMVGTAVTASATSQTVDFTAASGSTTSDVVIDGTIVKSDGSAPAGKIQVEVPTQMAFVVDKTGAIASTNYTVENKSDSQIKVSVANFKKRNAVNSKITLKPKDTEMTSLDRSNIQLYLVGQSPDKVVDLGNFEGASNKDLATIDAKGLATITLQGDAGKNVSNNGSDIEQNGASEQFDMVFKITKVD